MYSLLTTIQKLLNDPNAEHKETLQPLWSGYGEVSRYYSPRLSATVIAKSVVPPKEVNHPQGWHSQVSHQRKLNSYIIEAHFYQYYAQFCHQECYVPQIIAYLAEQKTDQGQTPPQILIMEDLQHLGFNNNNPLLSLTEIKAVIVWLANFHALFLHQRADGLWPIGTYWHLSTRQDEYNKMNDSPLKQAAQVIDATLNKAKYQTLVHGDAKLANFCFGNATNSLINGNIASSIAAVDFQYVGKGVGVKDLAYFLGSCLTDSDLVTLHDELLDLYFDSLTQAVSQSTLAMGKRKNNAVDIKALESEWRQLYSFANADFLRFLQGWNPEHHKINSYLKSQSDIALRILG